MQNFMCAGPTRKMPWLEPYKGDLKCFQISQFLTFCVAIGYK
jgi:hypothetical protein